MDRLSNIWSALREPLLGKSFSEIKRLCAAAGIPVEKLSHLTQAGKGYASKLELVDAIDGIYTRMSAQEQDRVTGSLLADLLREPGSLDRERMETLLERRGWSLIGSEPAPMRLAANYLEELEDEILAGLEKAVRRYRDGDRAGAVTALVGMVDARARQILIEHDGAASPKTPLHQRVKMAHERLKPHVMARFGALTDPMGAWKAQGDAVSAAANLLAQFRRESSDAHGGDFESDLVDEAARTAVFLLDSLTPRKGV
jgi:hypothetical protein